jgi:hypothetical protein
VAPELGPVKNVAGGIPAVDGYDCPGCPGPTRTSTGPSQSSARTAPPGRQLIVVVGPIPAATAPPACGNGPSPLRAHFRGEERVAGHVAKSNTAASKSVVITVAASPVA